MCTICLQTRPSQAYVYVKYKICWHTVGSWATSHSPCSGCTLANGSNNGHVATVLMLVFTHPVTPNFHSRVPQHFICRVLPLSVVLGASTASYTFSITDVHYVPIVGVKKERHIIDWSTEISAKVEPVTGITLRTTGPAPAACRK